MPQKGSIENPQFVLGSGVTLTLRPIPPILLERFPMDYADHVPPPEPPTITLKNGQPWKNINDPQFAKMYTAWEQRQQVAYVDYLIMAGVETEPPDDWEQNSFYPYQHKSRKVAWVEGMVATAEELGELAEMIASLKTATAKAIVDAEKNSPPMPEESPLEPTP